MKMFVQLIMSFHWLISPWRRADIFRYSPSSRKMVALFVNMGEWEKSKALERSHCNEAIAKWYRFFLSSNDVVFSIFQSSFIRISSGLNHFSFYLISFQHIRAVNTIMTVFLVFFIFIGNIALGHRTDISGNISWYRSRKQLLLY